MRHRDDEPDAIELCLIFRPYEGTPAKDNETLGWCLEGAAARGRLRSACDLRLKLQKRREKKHQEYLDRQAAHNRRRMSRYEEVRITAVPAYPSEPHVIRLATFSARPAPEPEIALDSPNAHGPIPPERPAQGGAAARA